MFDPSAVELIKSVSAFALMAYSEIRVRPLFRKILARSEEASANSAALCDHFGVKKMTDEEGDALAAREAPGIDASAVEEGAKVALRVLKATNDTTKTGA